MKITITGASSEIGLAIARTMGMPEDRMILHCFSRASQLQEAMSGSEKQIEVVPCDFTDAAALQQFAEKIKESDILINAAAVTLPNVLPALTDAELAKMTAVNISAPVLLCRSVIPAMAAKRKGVIISVSSVTASRANRGQSVYAGTKGFLEAFSRALAAEYGSRGLRINCVAPGPIAAGSLQETLAYAHEEIKKSNAFGRTGTPEDVAAAVAFLCGDGARFITGTVLHVDGGFMTGV